MLNGLEGAEFEQGDVLDVLNRLGSEGRRFGVVVCDPPKFARQAEDVEKRSRDTCDSTWLLSTYSSPMESW